MERYIMLIDDDSDEYILINDALSHIDNIKCQYARNAKLALEIMRQNPPSLVLLDMNMPEMNGLDCLIEMKECAMLSALPVIIYSNCVTDSLSRNAVTHGALACFKKPHTMAALHELLNNAFKLAELPDLLLPENSSKTQSSRSGGYPL